MSRKFSSLIKSELPKSPRSSLPAKHLFSDSVIASRNSLEPSSVKRGLVAKPTEPFKPLKGILKTSETTISAPTDPAVYTTPSIPLLGGVDVYIHEMSVSDWGWTENGFVQEDVPDQTPKSAKRVRFNVPHSDSSVPEENGLDFHIRELADADWGWSEWGLVEYHLDLQDEREMEELKEFELLEAMAIAEFTDEVEELKEFEFQEAMANAEYEDELSYLDLQDEREMEELKEFELLEATIVDAEFSDEIEELKEFEFQETMANSEFEDELL